jgi:glycosyltransferase involved in cell wall biosynthesis
MENKPLVSIITPCYNASKFIEECIKSVLSQDGPSVEQIIQDGGSTDGTVEIIKSYAEKYPDKIFFSSEPDHGQSDALNKAIQRSQGDILFVLNADDALLPHACAWAVENMAKYPEMAVIYGDVHTVDENGVFLEEFISLPYDFARLLCLELIPPAQASFISRACFEKVGFYADKDLDTCPDYEMWVRIGLVFPMKKVSGFISRYRKHYQATDSKAERTAQRFFDSKKLVMDRVFNSPRTPEAIRNLKTRAYSGLVVWAAATEFAVKHGQDIKQTGNLRNWIFVLTKLHHYSKGLPVEKYFIIRDVRWTGLSYSKRFIRLTVKKLLLNIPEQKLIWLGKISGLSDFNSPPPFVLDPHQDGITLVQKWQKLIYECLQTKRKIFPNPYE